MQKVEVETKLGNLFNLIQEKENHLNSVRLLIKQPNNTPEQVMELEEAKTNLIQILKKQDWSMRSSGIIPMIFKCF